MIGQSTMPETEALVTRIEELETALVAERNHGGLLWAKWVNVRTEISLLTQRFEEIRRRYRSELQSQGKAKWE